MARDYKVEIASFRLDGNKIAFKVTDEFGSVTSYHTNKAGEGLWRNGYQMLGTSQFRLLQDTRNGVWKAIDRFVREV